MTLDAIFTDATITLGAALGEVQTVQTVKPIPLTDEMTQPVGIDENGKLYTFPTTEGKDGFSPIVKLEQADDGVTIKVTNEGGITTVAKITNGKDGKNGITPEIELDPIENGIELTVNTYNSSTSAFIYNGKSAYEYAKEGGYTGTEEEFAEKLASTSSGIHVGSDAPANGSDVWIDTDEEAPESDGGGASINVTAEVGQTIVVKAVDTNGKPTEWESADYQPRTHWSELVELLPETNAVIDENEGVFVIPVDFVFKVGETYKIKYNGDEYVRTAFGFAAEGVTLAIVGNGVALGLDDTGEPFMMFIQDGVLIGFPLDGSAEGTVAIYGNEYHTIPQSYLPQPVHWIDAVEVDGAYEQITVTPAQTNAAIDAGMEVRLRIRTMDNNQTESIYILPCVTQMKILELSDKVCRLIFAGKVGIVPIDRKVYLSFDLSSGVEDINQVMNLPWVLLND